METHRILVVEDDPEIASALCRGLSRHGYDARPEPRADAVMGRIEEADAVILDVMLGAESGLDVARAIRGAGHRLPILMLSALSEVEDRAAGLEAGADDYIVKPFSFEELVARLKVQERRNASLGALLDEGARVLRAAGSQTHLTERECSLLALLTRRAGETLTRGAIFDTLWAGAGASSENVVDVYVGHLRRKIDPARPGFEIVTERGRGFALRGQPPRLA